MKTRVDNLSIAGIGRGIMVAGLLAAASLAGGCASTANLDAGAGVEQRGDGDPFIRANRVGRENHQEQKPFQREESAADFRSQLQHARKSRRSQLHRQAAAGDYRAHRQMR